MSDPAKTRRHAERIRELVASLVREIKDPRLGMVTVTDARITGDLRDAHVYYTVLGDQTEQAATAAALDSAKGMLRTRVGHALGLRHSPSLTFVLDNVQDNVKEIDELLAAARHRDAEVQRLAAGKEYAGDPDPYKADDEDDEDADERVGAREDQGVTEAVTITEGVPAAGYSAAVATIRELAPAGRVLLICHVNPDGDALGSMLGFGLGLRRLGVPRLQATFPGPFEIPEPFAALPGLDLLVSEQEAEQAPDLVIVFDVAAVSRLGALTDRLSRAQATVALDHHASNTGFAQINLVDAGAAATSVVVEELLRRLDVPLDAEIAECLYVALATDTGSFRFDLTTPRVHEMAARLIATGLRPGEISRRVFDSRPFGAMKLSADVLGRAQLDPTAAAGHGMVWTYATLADLERHGQRPYVLDALIDPVRCVAEVDVSVVVKQLAEREWAVSLRSKGAVDVSAVAVALGGGGHRLAAGFTGHGTPGDVVTSVRDELDRHLIT